MTRTMVILGSMVLSILTVGSYGLAEEAQPSPTATHMKVSGVVSKVETGLTTVKTPWGTMRIASGMTPKGLRSLKDQISWWS